MHRPRQSHERFRGAVIAATIVYAAQRQLAPAALRTIIRGAGHSAMSWLDARRDQVDTAPNDLKSTSY